MRSVKKKIIVLVLSCLLMSVAAIGGVGIYNTKMVVSADSTEIMNLLCNTKASELNALFSEIELSTETLRAYTVSQLESVERLKTDAAYVDTYTNGLLDIVVNAAKNTKGAMAVYVRFNPEFTNPQSGLFCSRRDKEGEFEVKTPTDLSLYDSSDIEHVGWFYIPVSNHKGTWIAPYYNKNIDVEMISYVIPFYAEDTLIGVVGMDIDFGLLKDIVNKTTVYETGYAFLIDDKANVIYHKELADGTSLEEINAGDLRNFAFAMKNEPYSKILYSYNYKGEKRSASFMSLSNGMKFVLTATVREIDRRANDMILQVVFWIVLIITVSVSISILMTRRLIRPLIELNVAAQKIAAGDLNVSLTYQSKDEIGALSESFRKTVDHLKHYIDYINGLAYRDLLTGLKNRTAYLEMESNMDELIRLKNPEFALIVFDVNGLKQVNDNFGHDFGDILIMDAAKIINNTFKRCPIYRIGGDEFVAFLEDSALESYVELLRLFENEMEDYNLHSNKEIKVSIARGIAIYSGETDYTFGDVFKRADNSMYENKAEMKKRDSI